MYIKNAPIIVAEWRTSFDNDSRTVIFDIHDDQGGRVQIRVPEGMMAAATGQFIRERMFGLH